MAIFNIPSDFAYLRSKGLSAFEVNTIILIANEYAKPNHGHWRTNT